MNWKACMLIIYLVFLAGCNSAESPVAPSPSSSPAETRSASSALATVTDNPPTQTNQPGPEPTATIVTPTETQTPTQVPTPTSTEEVPTAQQGQDVIVADQRVIDQFSEIPDEFVTEAASLRLLFRGSSIAHNINMGLDCLQGNFGGRRPNYCSDFTNGIYDRSNWDFPVRGNPGWIQKVDDFIELVNQNADQYDVFIFLVDYADGIDNSTYPQISDPENFQTRFVERLEELEQQHPDKIIVWTTMSMARTGFDNATKFNELLREYAADNGKILFDLAAIESHSPDGEAQFDEQNHEILFSGYTNESRSGHLNEVGTERVSRALWWFMARLAGWPGIE